MDKDTKIIDIKLPRGWEDLDNSLVTKEKEVLAIFEKMVMIRNEG